jgi:hypothetical protein
VIHYHVGGGYGAMEKQQALKQNRFAGATRRFADIF